jgi:uncharacterized protein YhfF
VARKVLLNGRDHASCNVRTASVTNRSATEVKAGQRRARLDDANQSTRPNTVTVRELQQRGR